MLQSGRSYDDMVSAFRWNIPEFYNIGVDICDKHAHRGHRQALIYEDEYGQTQIYSFADLKDLSDRFANVLRAHGIKTGDRVGILLPQCPETAVAHISTYKVGAIAVPLFTLFGPDALEYRLTNSETKCLITDASDIPKIEQIRERLPSLERVYLTSGEPRKADAGFWESIKQSSNRFEPVRTHADDPALIIYTSGTTGPPKGALHAHRILLGHLPGVELPHNLFPQREDLFWTPADWAWIGGLIDVLFPSWHHGIPVVAYRAQKFDPEYAFHLIAKYRIRNAFIPPTALKLMRQVSNPWKNNRFQMRSIGSGGETLGEELLEWGQRIMGLTINEFYGQTEANLVVGNCAEIMEIKPGSMGRSIPGHRVAIIDEDGHVLPPGTRGSVAIRKPDPVMFLQYWMNPEATQNKYVQNWCVTGDHARMDDEGYFWFVGREDDLITSAGYRIGPAEIEDCLMKHPAVTMAAVIGVPDEIRTEIVKAFIVLQSNARPGLHLKKQIQKYVKDKLAAYEYPREIEFVKELPMTATGKIIRKKLREMGRRNDP